MIRRRTHRRALGVTATALALALAGSTARAQGPAVLTGTIRDTVSEVPVPGAVVTVTSPSLQGEQPAVTDASGHYRIAGLPPGTYLIRIDKADYRPFARPQVDLRIDTTIRYDGQLLPETRRSDDIVIAPPAPGIDVGSSGTGVHVGADFMARIPLGPPGSKGAVTRSSSRRGKRARSWPRSTSSTCSISRPRWRAISASRSTASAPSTAARRRIFRDSRPRTARRSIPTTRTPASASRSPISLHARFDSVSPPRSEGAPRFHEQ